MIMMIVVAADVVFAKISLYVEMKDFEPSSCRSIFEAQSTKASDALFAI
jgi:hypothetical protein